jgi:hypothetical protein
VNLPGFPGVDYESETVREHLMKIVMSALVALLLGTAVMSTDASAQPRCWYHGYNHCSASPYWRSYSNGHHYGWWRHHDRWDHDRDRGWYR